MAHISSDLHLLTEFNQNVLKCLHPTTGRTRQCIASALRHLEKAELIKDLDSEMAAFRLITAEEEAATALFFTLKVLRYPRADLIRFTEHKFKLGLYPFLIAVSRLIGDGGGLFATQFRLSDLSTFDFFHPGNEAQQRLAATSYAVGYNW